MGNITRTIRLLVLASALVVITAAPVAAQDDGDPYVTQPPAGFVENQSLTAGPQPVVRSATAERGAVEAAPPSGLAFTGGDIAQLAVIGLAALVAGGFVIALRRRAAHS